MHNKFLLILAVWLLTGPVAANAELVQSSTSVYLTFRHCVSGETVCDSIVPVEVGRYGGLPGEPAAITSHADPTYGEASGSAQLTGAPGAAELSANATSLPSTRNGSNCVMLQRYTNKGANAETLTFGASLTYKQTIPTENAGFPADSPARSGAFAEIFIFSMDADSLEAGTTAEENSTALMEGLDPSIVTTELAFAGTAPLSNVTGSGTETLSSTVTVEPGDNIWLWVLLQSLAANGAEVRATLDTRLESTKAD
jgi:hypothetical protein